MTITYKNLLWLKNTPVKDFVSLMDAVIQNNPEQDRENFIQGLWEDIALMRHMDERSSYACKV